MLNPTQTKRGIVANFLTPSYRVIGTIHIGSAGLLGTLTSQGSAFVELVDATLARVHEPRKLVDRLDVVRLVKSGIVAVGVANRQDVGPQGVTRGGFGRTFEYLIRAVTATYEFDGTLEYAGRFDLSSILSQGMGEFVPLYDAKVRAIQFPDLYIESPAIIFNRRKVDVITRVQRNAGGAN